MYKSLHNKFKKILQEKAFKLLLMFGKTAKKAKLLNGYVKIAPQKLLLECLQKVATNLTAQICFKSSLGFSN